MPDYETIMNSAKEAIIETFKDIKDIEVITAVAEEVTIPAGALTNMEALKNVQLDKISYYARSTIQLEGDNYMLLPAGPNPVTVKEVTDIHQESTKHAVQTWNNMARVTFTALAIGAELAGKGLGEDVLKLIAQFGIINKTS